MLRILTGRRSTVPLKTRTGGSVGPVALVEAAVDLVVVVAGALAAVVEGVAAVVELTIVALAVGRPLFRMLEMLEMMSAMSSTFVWTLASGAPRSPVPG